MNNAFSAKAEPKQMKVLIVEDEPNYSDTLEMFVDELGYEVCGIADNGADAIDCFDAQTPDMVLMDININGGLSGIDLARIFQGKREIPIIFITSFDDKATFDQAKLSSPFAYLIKPFEPNELERSMELALQKVYGEAENLFEDEKELLLATNCFFVKDRNKLVKLRQEDIFWVEVEDKYCILHTKNRKYTLRKSLKELAEKLDSSIFVQTHRSFIVNANQIEDIDLSLFIVRVNGNEVPLGRGHKDELINRLQML